MSKLDRLLCRLNIHVVPQLRHPATRAWLWGSAEFVRTKNPHPYCIHEVDPYKTIRQELAHFRRSKNEA